MRNMHDSDQTNSNLQDFWQNTKRNLGLAEICHKLHFNPLYVVFVISTVVFFGVPLILVYLSVSIVLASLLYILTLMLYTSGFLIFFHRDPERNTLEKDNAILSPADGEIVYIKKIHKGDVPFSTKGKNKIKLDQLTKCCDFLEKDGYLIGVGMKLFDVHINRSPIQGVVKLSNHNSGKFISQTKKEFEMMNESQTTVIEHKKGYLIGFVQIATFLVRGIESYLHEGDLVMQGERVGRIKLGSQVDVVIPFIDVKIMVKPGERVYAGESILAEVTC